jgi:ABC-type transporter MlaC component
MRRFAVFAFIAVMTIVAPALAVTPTQFVQDEHKLLGALATQPVSPQRDAQLAATLDQLIDYDEFARRCLRVHWNQLGSRQQTEVTELLARIVRANYFTNITRTLDYSSVAGRVTTQGTDVIVRMRMDPPNQSQNPSFDMAYVLRPAAWGAPFRVVDVLAEGSSTTANYFRDFDRMLTTSGLGYNFLIGKLKHKISLLAPFTSNLPVVISSAPPTSTSSSSSQQQSTQRPAPIRITDE